MLSWCAYCQQFQGEIPPFDNYKISHGLCGSCKAKGTDLTNQEFAAIHKLRDVQKELLQAGLSRDIKTAEVALARARDFGTRDIDILLGLITPLLWQIGDMWACGSITVADEHNFTAFYNPIIELIEKSEQLKGQELPNAQVDILVLVCPGNIHDIGARIFDCWLRSKGLRSRLLPKGVKLEQIIEQVKASKPRFVGVSVALLSQIPEAVKIKDNLQLHFGENCPQVLVGGYLLKNSTEPLHEDKITFMQIGPELLELLAP